MKSAESVASSSHERFLCGVRYGLMAFYPQENFLHSWSQCPQTLCQLSLCPILSPLLSFRQSPPHPRQEEVLPSPNPLLWTQHTLYSLRERVAPNLQFVKNAISAKHDKTRCARVITCHIRRVTFIIVALGRHLLQCWALSLSRFVLTVTPRAMPWVLMLQTGHQGSESQKNKQGKYYMITLICGH